MDKRDQTEREEEVVRQLLEAAGPRPPIPEEDLDVISAAARSAWRTQVRQRTPERRPLRALPWALAAAVAIAVGLTMWWASRGERVPSTVAWIETVTGPVHLESESNDSRAIDRGESIPLGAFLRSTESARAAVKLAGGATVRLDTETRVRFVSADVLDLERGAVYVDTGLVAQPRTALEVRTPLGTARDIGTQFAVRIVGSNGTALLVRVRDGAVLTEQRGHTYRTGAGEELVLRHDGTTERRKVALSGADWEWVLAASPRFDIEGRTLGEFLDWISRETGWRIDFADEGLANSADEIVLHGSIGDLRPDRAPFAVLPGAGLAGEIEDGTLVVQRRR